MTLLPKAPYCVVASSDENYAPYLLVVFVSLLKNTASVSDIALYCLDGGISRKTQLWMNDQLQRFGQSVEFVQIDSGELDRIPTIKHITSSAYYRIAIPDLFHESVERILYLDCDVIVKDDVTRLWDLDSGSCHIAAVENLSSHTYKALGIPRDEYFNSGVMLMNLALWRRDEIARKVLQFKQENTERITTNDQCALNGVLHRSWHRLPLRWNHQSSLYHSGINRDGRLDEKEMWEAIQNPAVIHYIGWDKPWKRIRYHPLAGEFDRYADAIDGMRRERPGITDYLRLLGSLKRLRKWIRRARWRRWYRHYGF